MEEKIIEIETKLDSQIEKIKNHLLKEFALIRTGRANPAILDNIKVEYYGVLSPLNQVATIQVVEGSQLYIKPFDRTMIKEIETKINESDLNLPPLNDGNGIRISLPKLTEEKRKEISKEVFKKSENAKIQVRNERRDANDLIKQLKLPEDLEKDTLNEIQKTIDRSIEEIDNLAKEKEREVMKI